MPDSDERSPTMMRTLASLIVLSGALLAFCGRVDAAPPAGFGAMPGSNPRTWSPNPIKPVVMPGSDPRTWSPYPIKPVVMPGSDPRTWSPYPYRPIYDTNPIPYWLQNPYWRSMPNPYPYPPYPYVNPYLYPYYYNFNPTGITVNDAFNVPMY
jgi:hypothetical protein